MKKILLALTALMVVGCDVKQSDGTYKPYSYRTYIIDSCEYVGYAMSSQYDYLAHKGNCRFCKERRQKDLEEAAERLSTIYAGEGSVDPKREGFAFYIGFKNGAKWKNENLWKPADGDDLPEIDREVIALFDNGKVGFAHRPPEYWDGKNVVTGKVTRNYPKTYDKGGWNIPDVKWWLDCQIPKMGEV